MSTIRSILLVGAGQLGRRHLQGLAHIDIPVSIEVVDPVPAALEAARESFGEIAAAPGIAGVTFSTSVGEGGAPVDLAVIATASDVRAQAISSLLAKRSVRNLLLEKFLFQRESEYQAMGALMQERGAAAFVNCPRRIYPYYRRLREELPGEGALTFRVSGSTWGLACNSVHFLDLFAFLTGDSRIEMGEVLLDPVVLESKRPGFVEFTGTLRGTNSRGDTFEISCTEEPGHPVQVSLETPGRRIEIVEAAGKATVFAAGSGTGREEPFSVLYQSQLTGLVASEVVRTGTCGLTPYPESARLHLPILRTFLEHLGKVAGTARDACPIT